MRFPPWKIVLVLVVTALGFLFAAPSLAPREEADQWPSWLQPVNLGLDLQGGSHLVLEVEVGAVVKERLNSLVESIRTNLRKERIRYVDLGVKGEAVTVRVLDSAEADKAREVLRAIDPGIQIERADGLFTLTYTDQTLVEMRTSAVDQSLEIVRRRIDELGTREPTIVRQGQDRILVQLPGVSEPERVKALIGKTAKLTFHLVDETVTPEEAAMGRIPPGSELIATNAPKQGEPAAEVVRKRVEVGGESLVNAAATFQNGAPVVSFQFDSVGARRFGAATQENTGRRLAIVLDQKVISAPVIREPILGGQGIISGNFTTQEAQDLALLLRAGALPAPLVVLEERTVGPDLGADSIRAGAVASVIGLVLVVLGMVVFYGLFGLIADIALIVNLALLLGGLSFIGATLTLPGIAGIVLTMGMAVDANVLIFERIREEARLGRGVIGALQAGFDRAFITILDSNLTTLMAAALLFGLGSGPVRGFAVTLTIGLITSMFSAILLTKLMLWLWVHYTRPKTLPV